MRALHAFAFSMCLIPSCISCSDIICKRYKEYAFLRNPDFTEQLVNYLLSLTAVDFWAFSTNYPPVRIEYQVEIHTSRYVRSRD